MKPLRQALTDYLALRRTMGYKLTNQERLLRQFLDYLEAQGEERISTEHALIWATLPGGDRAWHYNRLQAVRGFARYLHAIDPHVQVPATDLLPRQRRRTVPYLYSDEQIAALMAAAGTLRTPHRAATYRTLIGLLAVTGIRVGEAIGLNCEDINWCAGTITIRLGKFGKSRELPAHPITLEALDGYLLGGDRPSPAAATEPLLVSMAGTRLLHACVESTFRILRERAGINPRTSACRPHLHGLRHSFAVRTLLDAYRSGEDAQSRVALLSTYMGHVDPAGTYWYLQAAPELLALAGQRLEAHVQGGKR
jgi:integrase/recombinase XerD